MLENGTITTDEALTLLENLNGNKQTGQGTTETKSIHPGRNYKHKAKPIRKPQRKRRRVLNKETKNQATQENE